MDFYYSKAACLKFFMHCSYKQARTPAYKKLLGVNNLENDDIKH